MSGRHHEVIGIPVHTLEEIYGPNRKFSVPPRGVLIQEEIEGYVAQRRESDSLIPSGLEPGEYLLQSRVLTQHLTVDIGLIQVLETAFNSSVSGRNLPFPVALLLSDLGLLRR